MTNPHGPNTVVVTYSITAAQLHEMAGHLPIPIFVSENNPKRDQRGWLAALSRLVSVVSVESGSDIGNREQISVEFEDGTPGRVFDLEDPVDVHMIWPGRDLTDALGGTPPEADS